jgi:hypothetical protein
MIGCCRSESPVSGLAVSPAPTAHYLRLTDLWHLGMARLAVAKDALDEGRTLERLEAKVLLMDRRGWQE